MKKLKLKEIIKLNEAKSILVSTPEYSTEELKEQLMKEFKRKTSDENLIWNTKFVLTEMIDNAIYHGNHLDTSKKIKINMAWKKNNFYFVVQDEGQGFNMKNPRRSPGPPESGLGIFYSKRKADLVYNFGDSASYVCINVPKNKLKTEATK